MTRAPADARRPAHARDAAIVRLRRVTQLSIALTVAAGGAFTALAAGSTHTKKTTVVRIPARRVAAHAAAVVVQAPAPPLVSAQSAPTAPSEAPAPAPAPAASAPAPTYQQPVVVSGGS